MFFTKHKKELKKRNTIRERIMKFLIFLIGNCNNYTLIRVDALFYVVSYLVIYMRVVRSNPIKYPKIK